MSRRKRNFFILLAVMLAAAVILFDRIAGFRHRPGYRQTTQTFSPDMAKYHRKTFRVVKVVDGDTLDINAPDGKYPNTRIRLLGIDTPETKHKSLGVMYFGPEASAFANEKALNKSVVVLLDKISPTRDKFNRLLGYVKLSDGKVLNALLIEQGFAYADLRFDHSFYKKYQQLERAAQKSHIGLWKEVTPEQMPPWRQRMKYPRENDN